MTSVFTGTAEARSTKACTLSCGEAVCPGCRFTAATTTSRGPGSAIGSSRSSSQKTVPSGAFWSRSWISTAAAPPGAGASSVTRTHPSALVVR